MIDTLESDIIRILSKCADDVRANMQAQGVNASGRTSASVRVREVDGHGFQLVAGQDSDHEIDAGKHGTMTVRDTAPFPTVEVGRPAGAVPFGFYYIIKQWTKDKGLSFASDSERATFAWFVSKKIKREGTRRNASPIDVYSTAARNAADEVRKVCASFVSKNVRAALGRMSVTTNTNF